VVLAEQLSELPGAEKGARLTEGDGRGGRRMLPHLRAFADAWLITSADLPHPFVEE